MKKMLILSVLPVLTACGAESYHGAQSFDSQDSLRRDRTKAQLDVVEISAYDQAYGMYGLGDINGDGHADYMTNHRAGDMAIYSGRTGETLLQRDDVSTMNAGFDFDGDGVGDFCLTPYNGTTEVYSGTDLARIFTAEHAWLCASPGDVNGDGFDDLYGALETRFDNGVSIVELRVVAGLTGELLMHREISFPFGYVLNGIRGGRTSKIGDVNNDGFDDLALGFIRAKDEEGRGSGRFMVFSGKDGSILLDQYGAPLHANDHDVWLGAATAGVGDIDGDDHADFVVSAPMMNTKRGGDGQQGMIYLYSGRDFSIIRTIRGQSEHSVLGLTVASVGDFDGDGVHDIVLSARDRGVPMYRVLAITGDRIVHDGFSSDRAASGVFPVVGIGDVDGNGRDDIAVNLPTDPGNFRMGILSAR